MPIALSAERSVAPVCEGRRFSRVRPEAGRTTLMGSRSASLSIVTLFVVPFSIEPLVLGLLPIVSPRRGLSLNVTRLIASSRSEPVCSVITVVARRTFWEKATILHAEYHRPLESSLPQRYSRHYSDVTAMSRAAVKEEALADLPLLQRVIEHKDRFYHAAWARYTEAHPGSFKVMPREERLDVLRRDHQAMHPMFLGDPPRFEDILQDLESLEREINALTSS